MNSRIPIAPMITSQYQVIKALSYLCLRLFQLYQDDRTDPKMLLTLLKVVKSDTQIKIQLLFQGFV